MTRESDSEHSESDSPINKVMFRQGDVLVMSAEELPGNAEEVAWEGRVVLAYGELTGHAHAIDAAHAKMYAQGDARYIVVGDEGAELKHEEHSAIILKSGVYRIIQQREYAPDAERLVMD